jgi:peptide subunit release factor 1 (eRF1)
MITREQIEQLEAFDAGGARVLSVYLDLDPARQIERTYRIAFKDLVKEARERLEKPARKQLLHEAARVQAWLEDAEPGGKGLAVFSCEPRSLWQAHLLPGPVDDHLAFEPRPDVTPLLELVDEYERYAVALVDKRKARLFTVFLGKIEESDRLRDFVPGKHDQGGLSQPNYQRHHEAHVHWHLKRVAEHLAELFRRRSFDRLILGGPEEATSELRRMLPRALAQRLVAVIPVELSASEGEILAETLRIEERVEREFEERLLDELLDVAGAGGRATYGLSPTLEALGLGDVQTLVVSRSARVGGSECTQCGRLEPGGVSTCPACGAPMHPVHDLFERAMERALEHAGMVEVVHGDAAQRLLELGEGMGAMLRYTPTMKASIADDRSS